jgi:hypothetical protein
LRRVAPKFDWRLTVLEIKRPIWIVCAGDDCDGIAALRPTYRKTRLWNRQHPGISLFMTGRAIKRDFRKLTRARQAELRRVAVAR